MTQSDWFRNTEWNDDIGKVFFEKLKRAKDKSQYLRIQASYLVEKKPTVAIELLEKYLAIDSNHFDVAMAYLHKAIAYENLQNIEEALLNFKKCLERQKENKNLITSAWIDFPLFCLRHKLSNEYLFALEVIEKKPELLFPVDSFRYHYAQTEMSLYFGNTEKVSQHLELAISYSQQTKSGLPRHPKVGLVCEKDDLLISRLKKIKSNM